MMVREKPMLLTITPEKIDLPPGTLLQFPGTIDDYEELLAQIGDRSIPRIRLREQNILLMSPLPKHGKEIYIITNLVNALLLDQGRDWEGFHPITLRRGKEAGLEPDVCFYIRKENPLSNAMDHYFSIPLYALNLPSLTTKDKSL